MVINSRSLSTRLARFYRRPATLCWLAVAATLLAALPGCSEQGGEVTFQPPATSASQQATATVSTRAPARTATLPPATVADAAPSATPCAHDFFFTPAPPLCPREAAVESAAAEQPFTGGVMIWLESAGAIHVFFPDGSWQRFADTWTEAEAESDPSLTPPAGLFQPIRGFGKVWREHPDLRERLGWATGVELGYTAAVQRPVAEAGEQITFLRTYNGQVYYLNELEPDSGTWGIAASG